MPQVQSHSGFRKIATMACKWQSTPVFLPREFHRQRGLVGYSPWGYKRVGHDLATKQQYVYIYIYTYCIHMYIHIYTYTYCIHIYIYIYIYI